ncbi:DivIVA domain-containing protein [Isoptericola sp. NPDC057653]|uniref:DivIVA domain-containing protein n=1 Tax=Isoptericola sp. NPDC057653 TaxID=3346195 RepID=UPI00368585E7
MSESLAVEILAKRFATTRLREGYDPSDVDDLLDQVVRAVEGGTDVAALVDGARFASTTFREGYDMTEVDDYLDEIKERVASAGETAAADAAPSVGAGGPEPRRAPSSGTTLPSPTLPAGTGGLLDWFTRRRRG